MEVGLRFRGSGEGSFRGEGDLAPTRYEWGRGIGRGVEPCLTDAFVSNVGWGGLQVYPCL